MHYLYNISTPQLKMHGDVVNQVVYLIIVLYEHDHSVFFFSLFGIISLQVSAYLCT